MPYLNKTLHLSFNVIKAMNLTEANRNTITHILETLRPLLSESHWGKLPTQSIAKTFGLDEAHRILVRTRTRKTRIEYSFDSGRAFQWHYHLGLISIYIQEIPIRGNGWGRKEVSLLNGYNH